jgi:hypothetical protein
VAMNMFVPSFQSWIVAVEVMVEIADHLVTVFLGNHSVIHYSFVGTDYSFFEVPDRVLQMIAAIVVEVVEEEVMTTFEDNLVETEA